MFVAGRSDLTANKSCCVQQKRDRERRPAEVDLCLNFKVLRIPPEAGAFRREDF